MDGGGLGEIAGVTLLVKQAGWLTEFGFVANFGGTRGYLALYNKDTNGDGEPSTLVASTQEFTVAGDPQIAMPQTTLVPVEPPQYVPAGDYWVLGDWQSDVFLISYTESPEDGGCAEDCVDWYETNGPFGPFETQPAPPHVSLAQLPEPAIFVDILVSQ